MSARAPIASPPETEARALPRRPVLTDAFGRTLSYLRVSLTERCQMRCGYCTPAGRLAPEGRDQDLRPSERRRLLAAFRALGMCHVRFTGGEPLLHPHLGEHIAEARSLGLPRISLTTNGHLLARKAQDLAASGLHDVNVSVDSLDPARFRAITGGGDLARVLAGLEAARRFLGRVKMNTVLLRTRNLSEVPRLVAFALTHDYDIRFIETMPLGAAGAAAVASDFVAAEVARAMIAERYTLRALPGVADAGPARRYAVEGGTIEIGFISPLSENFCGTCNRLRLTARGHLVYCLGRTEGLDLRAALDQGLTPDELAHFIRTHVARDKPRGHGFTPEGRPVPVRMMAIGG